MLGRPKYKHGQHVIFTFNNTELKGVISVVDPQGGGIHWGDDVSYDIFAIYKGEDTLFKHIEESLVELDTDYINKVKTQKFLLSFDTYTSAIKAISTEPYNVIVKEYDDRILLLYNHIASPRDNEIVNECRGLILSKDFKIVMSRPFERFYNLGEENANNIDFNFTKAIVQEKVDGTLIQVYHDSEKWCIATKGMAFAEGAVHNHKGMTFRELFMQSALFENEEEFQEYFDKVATDSKEYTFLFELVGPENRVVTNYTKRSVKFLEAIHKEFGDLASENEIERYNSLLRRMLKASPDKERFNSIEMFEVNSLEEVLNKVQELQILDEGFVCIEQNTKRRIKVKQASYLENAYIRASIERRIAHAIELVFQNEHYEHLAVFPEEAILFDYLVETYTNHFNTIEQEWNKYKNIKDGKAFAHAISNSQYKTFLFKKRTKQEAHIKDILAELTFAKKVKLLGEIPAGIMDKFKVL